MERKAISGLLPKNQYYRSDGSGRDTYISFNNGGAFKSFNNFPNTPKLMLRALTPASKASVRSLHYIADGSGRDSYITVSDGGLHNSASPQHSMHRFKSSLRNYEPQKVSQDSFAISQANWKPIKAKIVCNIKYRTIKKCVSRLYKTK